MNHIIHHCTHAAVDKEFGQISEAEMFRGMDEYLEVSLHVMLALALG